MRWWDTSALVALLSNEPATARVEETMAIDGEIAVWWGTKAEGVSAISRVQRAGALSTHLTTELLVRFDRVLAPALEVPPTEEVRDIACRLLRVHDLSAADGLQLAAALVWTEYKADGVGFVCLDRKLCEAAAREGFRVLPEFDEFTSLR